MNKLKAIWILMDEEYKSYLKKHGIRPFGEPKSVEVDSSNILSLSWKNKTLRVLFTNGSTYVYQEVPKSIYSIILNSSSIGGSIHSILVRGGYPYYRES